MTDSDRLTIRTTKSLRIAVEKIAARRQQSTSELVRTYIRVGMENSKEADEILERKRLLAIEAEKYEEANEELNLELKKAFLVENFRKLYRRIIQSSMSDERRQAVTDAMINRVKMTLGAESKEYREVMQYVRREKSSA